MNYWSPLDAATFWTILICLSIAAIFVWHAFIPYRPKNTKNTKSPPGGPPPSPAEPAFPYLTIVQYDTTGIPAHQIDTTVPIQAGRDYLFLGEVPDTPGLCVVADFRSGQIYVNNTKMFRKSIR
jgi:hypothetical protein